MFNKNKLKSKKKNRKSSWINIAVGYFYEISHSTSNNISIKKTSNLKKKWTNIAQEKKQKFILLSNNAGTIIASLLYCSMHACNIFFF